MWIAMGLGVSAFLIVAYAFRELSGFAKAGAFGVAFLLVLCALGPAAGHSVHWWIPAARHIIRHFAARF